jgi:hypothetical protein
MRPIHTSNKDGLDNNLEHTSRRSFLKLGFVSTGVLASASMVSGLTGCAAIPKTQTTSPLKLLRPKDVVILESLAPIVLADCIPENPQQRAVALKQLIESTDDFLFSSSPFNHHALAELFDLLYLPPTRIALAGVWNNWEDASASSKEHFLTSWRDSSFGLFRTGYTQITQLLAIAWYKNPAHWGNNIYPGPPLHIV